MAHAEVQAPILLTASRPARRSDHSQGFPAPVERSELPQVGKLSAVIDMQMRQEDIVDLRHRHLIGDDVAETAGAEIEEQALRTAQFDHNASSGLVEPRRPRIAAHEDYAHFVWPERFGLREVVVFIFDRRRWEIVRRHRDATARRRPIGIFLVGRSWLCFFFVDVFHDRLLFQFPPVSRSWTLATQNTN